MSSCGFDSIPNDLGVIYTEQQFKGELQYVESFLKVDRQGKVCGVCVCVCVCVYDAIQRPHSTDCTEGMLALVQ